MAAASSDESRWRSRWGQLSSLREGWASAPEAAKGQLCGADQGRLDVLLLMHNEAFRRDWGDPPKVSDVVRAALAGISASNGLEGLRHEAEAWLRQANEAHEARLRARAEKRGTGDSSMTDTR